MCCVRIAAINWPPKMILRDTHLSNHYQLEGIWGLITDIIFNSLNISYTIVVPNDGKTWGHLNESTGYYDGLIGLLQTNKADIIPVTTENLKRRETIDYTAPLEVTQTSILTSVLLSSNVKIDVIQHFVDIDLTTWLLLFICALVTSSLIYKHYKSNQLMNISNYIWISWKVMTLQKFEYKTLRAYRSRITLSLTYIGICFIIYYFYATIRSNVLLKNTSETIDSLEDLIDNQNMRPAFFEGTAHEAWFINNKNYINKRILSKSIHFKGHQMFSDNIFLPLIQNKIVVIAGTENLESISVKACDRYQSSRFYVASKTFNDNRNGFALRKNIDSKFRRKFLKKVKDVSASGIFEFINRKEIVRFAGQYKNMQCLINANIRDLNEDPHQPIDIKSLLSLFITFSLLLLISFLTLTFEIFYHKIRAKKSLLLFIA